MSEPPPVAPIVYKPVLLSYLDVLGFRDMIDKSKTNVYKVQETFALLHHMKLQYSGMRRFATTDGKTPRPITHFKNFSDLIIRATELVDDDMLADYLNLEFMALAGTQCNSVCQGDLLRGAVCIGDLYIDDDVTFGPALVEAYTLESTVAVFPRIVIDKEVIRKSRYEADGPIWNDFVARGEDGVYFIDYLFGSFLDRWSYPVEEQIPANAMLLIHKEFVEELLMTWTKEGEYRKRQKALWLAQYHNSTVKRLRARFKGMSGENEILDVEVAEHLYEF
jgi:hypothetical protein